MSSEEQSLAVVLSGGGCRTFWSLGAVQRLRPFLPTVTEWAGVSAGAAMAAALAVDRARETVEDFQARAAANRSNVYPLRLLSGKPVFPHEKMYRDTILHVLENGGFEALNDAAPLRILLAYLADSFSPYGTIVGAVSAYRRRKRGKVLHGPVRVHPGLRIEVVTVQDCETPTAVCDVILASSSTPPLTAIQTIDGRRYVDGALVDHAPIRALGPSARRGKAIVLTTNCIPLDDLPKVPDRLYLAPSRELPIRVWDYASPDKVQETFEQGFQDAEPFLPLLEDFFGADS